MARAPFDPNRIRVPREEQRLIKETSLLDDATLTVTQVTQMVKRAIEQHVPKTVHLVGEISNFKRHSSGHLYFVLKDEHSEIGCVMWKTVASKLKFDPSDGLEVFATGGVDVFERSGRYQLYVRRMEPKGVGALELAFRQLREKLKNEGLFDPARKKPLPRVPSRIAIVTSPTGAAIRDIINTIARRFPNIELMLYPVAVQGERATSEISTAIRDLNANNAHLGGIDLIIVGRGGGSLEDLWAFNEEQVARAIFDSSIPVISAVGHEVDVSISDLVADVRAATPTAAAELAVPVRHELEAGLEKIARQIHRLLYHRLEIARSSLEGLLNRRPHQDPEQIIRHREESVDRCATQLAHGISNQLHKANRTLNEAEVLLQRIRPDTLISRQKHSVSNVVDRLRWAMAERCRRSDRALLSAEHRLASASPQHRIVRLADSVENLSARLEAMSHKATLRRGFSITRTRRGKEVIRSTDQVRDDDVLLTETIDGTLESRVINRTQLELFE